MGILYKPVSPAIYGLEAEVGPREGVWSLGALYQMRVSDPNGPNAAHGWTNPSTIATWARFRVPLDRGDDFGVLAGLSYDDSTGQFRQEVDLAPWQNVGPVIGLFYTMRSGPIYLRFTPHYVFFPSRPEIVNPWIFKSGIPWIEAGVELYPGVLLSFRGTEAFTRLSYKF